MQGPEVALLVFIFIVGIAGICLCILDRRSKKRKFNSTNNSTNYTEGK